MEGRSLQTVAIMKRILDLLIFQMQERRERAFNPAEIAGRKGTKWAPSVQKMVWLPVT